MAMLNNQRVYYTIKNGDWGMDISVVAPSGGRTSVINTTGRPKTTRSKFCLRWNFSSWTKNDHGMGIPGNPLLPFRQKGTY